MAEIEIEKKKSIWPWIMVAIIIIAAILYFVFANDDESDEVEEGATTEQVIQEEPMETSDTDNSYTDNNNGNNAEAVQEYSNYIDNPNMGEDHEYTNAALLKLITAVKAVADSANVNVDADLSEAKSKAQKITDDPSASNHANKIKNSGQIIVNALHTIQQQKFPDLQDEYNEVETAIGQIDPTQEVLNEKDAIKGFFDKTEQLLNSMK